jgi:hypothetical protein
LYLFLLTVADAEGLSFYSDPALVRILTLDSAALAQARRELLEAHLIAYEKPLYQVLSLDPPLWAPARPPQSEPVPVGAILQDLFTGKIP